MEGTTDGQNVDLWQVYLQLIISNPTKFNSLVGNSSSSPLFGHCGFGNGAAAHDHPGCGDCDLPRTTPYAPNSSAGLIMKHLYCVSTREVMARDPKLGVSPLPRFSPVKKMRSFALRSKVRPKYRGDPGSISF